MRYILGFIFGNCIGNQLQFDICHHAMGNRWARAYLAKISNTEYHFWLFVVFDMICYFNFIWHSVTQSYIPMYFRCMFWFKYWLLWIWYCRISICGHCGRLSKNMSTKWSMPILDSVWGDLFLEKCYDECWITGRSDFWA